MTLPGDSCYQLNRVIVSLRNHQAERGQTLHAEPITPIPNLFAPPDNNQ